MEKVTISPEFQVVIPRSVRERLNLRPGQQVQVIPHEDRIEFIPLRPARELRGSLRGMPRIALLVAAAAAMRAL